MTCIRESKSAQVIPAGELRWISHHLKFDGAADPDLHALRSISADAPGAELKPAMRSAGRGINGTRHMLVCLLLRFSNGKYAVEDE